MICLTLSSALIAQQKEDTTITAKTIESKIITFPIKATTTTDPNYEINKKKSEEVQKKMSTEPNVLIKNDAYYNSNIKELKRRISEIENNPTSPNVNVEKLEGLKEELVTLQNEYNVFLKSK